MGLRKNEIGEPRDGTVYRTFIGDGRELTVCPMTFGKARLCIGPVDSPGYDDGWCYEDVPKAVLAAMVWDGDGDDPPFGWHRHIKTGRRRPNGDPALEYVNP